MNARGLRAHTVCSQPATMNQLFPVLSCLLLGLFSAYFLGSAAETYSIGTRFLANCSKGTPASACRKKYLMFSFPRVGRSEGGEGFPRSQRVIGIVKQPRIGRSDPSLLQFQPDSQRMIYDTDDQPDKAHMDYQRRALVQPDRDYSRNLDNYLASRRSMAPWAFFLITPNFQNTEHAMDNLILPRLDHQLDSHDNDE